MQNNDTAQGIKSGYLLQDFQLFHITDQTTQTFEYHYHEFNKIIISLSGNVTYVIEGTTYRLKPWDILLVKSHDVHKSVIDKNDTYDRIVLWVDTDFLMEQSNSSCDLTTCFDLADKKSFNLIRLDAKLQEKLKTTMTDLEDATLSTEFGSELLARSLFLQFMVYLNRIYQNNNYIYDQNAIEYDNQIADILNYIKENLEGDLSVEAIASNFFLSKHYLMHKFKAKTGYTLHNYILNRRLFKTMELIKTGTPITSAASLAGFQDYSTFSRAFRKNYHCSPREFFSLT